MRLHGFNLLMSGLLLTWLGQRHWKLPVFADFCYLVHSSWRCGRRSACVRCLWQRRYVDFRANDKPRVCCLLFASTSACANVASHLSEYGLPMDDQELDRMDLCHTKYYALLKQRRFLSPIGENPQRILDLGCGTGKST